MKTHIAFSGGRSSGLMLHMLLERFGRLPDDARVIFTNTGREMPETLDFVQACSDRWGVPITWLEYCPHNGFQEVTRDTASETGEPFERLISKRQYLPNVVSRFCTAELKVRPAAKYLTALGWDTWEVQLGIRADEPLRLRRSQREKWTIAFPLAEAGVTRADVVAFWERQPFDLDLPVVAGKTPMGNCDGCFLKSEAYLAGFARDFPERAKWWEEQELRASEWTLGNGATFSKRYSRAELRHFVSRQADWVLDETDTFCQADDGECL